MPDCFYKNGLLFSCKQCSHCCRHEPGYVYLSKNDLTNLLHWSNLSVTDFFNKYCRWVPYYDGTEVLCLQEQKNYDCVFWKDGCLAYEARPIQCITFPFWNFIIKDAASWNEAAESCPGINSGKMHDFNEIEQSMSEYQHNIPLDRNQFREMVGDVSR